MILYTMMPYDLVYPTDGSEFARQTVINIEGVPLLVDMDGSQDCRVVRLLSSDPEHFMDSRWTPGARVPII